MPTYWDEFILKFAKDLPDLSQRQLLEKFAEVVDCYTVDDIADIFGDTP